VREIKNGDVLQIERVELSKCSELRALSAFSRQLLRGSAADMHEIKNGDV
jgi:hypothetical protein